jgi:hypothetical protein
MLIGATFSIAAPGITLTVNYGTTFTDFGIQGGIQIDFLGGLTFNFSRSLGNVIAPSVRITDPIYITPNSTLQVQYLNRISRGQNGDYWQGNNGGFFGGGNGEFGGGGGTGGGGGGAGNAYINVLQGFTGITGAGSGTTPFIGQYNIDGSVGFGGSGASGGLPYYVIEAIQPGSKPDVLEVNGNEIINGNIDINGSITVNQPQTGGTRVAWFTNNSSDFNNGRSIAIFHDQNPGPMIVFSENVTGLSGQGGQLSFVRNTTINSSLAGNFNMDRPLRVQGNIFGFQTPIKVLLDTPVEVATNYIVPPTLSGTSGYLVHVKMMGGGGSAGAGGGGGGSGLIVDTDGIKVVGGASILYLIGEGGGGTGGGPGGGGQSEITFPGFKKLIAEGGDPGAFNGGNGGYGGGGGNGFGAGGLGQLGDGNNAASGGEGGGPSILGIASIGVRTSGGGGNGSATAGGGGGLGGGNAGGSFQDPQKNATYYGAGGGGPFFTDNLTIADGRGFQGVIFLTLTPY